MRRHRKPARGFTIVELAVVLGIVGVLAVLAVDGLLRARPRANFQNVSVELQALVHAARLKALASGLPVAVLVFPDYRGRDSQGRIVVIQDPPAPADSLFSATAALNLDSYDPATVNAPPGGEVVASLDLPQTVAVGPPMGNGLAPVPFPFDGANTRVDCSFCSTGTQRRGAIRFDARGKVVFYDRVASTLLGVRAASITLYPPDLFIGNKVTTSTLVITSPAAAMRVFKNAYDITTGT